MKYFILLLLAFSFAVVEPCDEKKAESKASECLLPLANKFDNVGKAALSGGNQTVEKVVAELCSATLDGMKCVHKAVYDECGMARARKQVKKGMNGIDGFSNNIKECKEVKDYIEKGGAGIAQRFNFHTQYPGIHCVKAHRDPTEFLDFGQISST